MKINAIAISLFLGATASYVAGQNPQDQTSTQNPSSADDTNESCSKSEFYCEGDKLARCVYGKPVLLSCAPGTTCSIVNGAGSCVVATATYSSQETSSRPNSPTSTSSEDDLEDCDDEDKPGQSSSDKSPQQNSPSGSEEDLEDCEDEEKPGQSASDKSPKQDPNGDMEDCEHEEGGKPGASKQNPDGNMEQEDSPSQKPPAYY